MLIILRRWECNSRQPHHLSTALYPWRWEMNHSPRFWAKLDEFAQSKSNLLRRELRNYRTGL
ncbi:MAG: hypothetical protein ACOYOT_02305 [Bacteroidales bacterium]